MTAAINLHATTDQEVDKPSLWNNMYIICILRSIDAAQGSFPSRPLCKKWRLIS
jgi:hypothetical protein